MKDLIIVESPGKIKKIQSYVGNNYIVVASFGHIYNLVRKNMGIDVKKNFSPTYEIVKPKIAKNIINVYKKCNKCFLAADEDREGEAIAWHLAKLLKLNLREKNRIVFNEITKPAILNALQNPRTINMKIVNAQQARRIVDRIVGFTLSPLLWFINRNLSAGRVQSVGLKLIVEREGEVRRMKAKTLWKVEGNFGDNIDAKFSKNLRTQTESQKYLLKFSKEIFKIINITVNNVHSNPPKPFITSTLQQIAGSSLGYSSKQTMVVAQKLYEKGLITYHRTDSYKKEENMSQKIKMLKKHMKQSDQQILII